jgi:hypothetical protein
MHVTAGLAEFSMKQCTRLKAIWVLGSRPKTSGLTFISEELQLEIWVPGMLVLVIVAIIGGRILLFPSNLDRKVILKRSSWLGHKTFCFDAYTFFVNDRKMIVVQQNAIQQQRASPAVGCAGSESWQGCVGPWQIVVVSFFKKV